MSNADFDIDENNRMTPGRGSATLMAAASRDIKPWEGEMAARSVSTPAVRPISNTDFGAYLRHTAPDAKCPICSNPFFSTFSDEDVVTLSASSAACFETEAVSTKVDSVILVFPIACTKCFYIMLFSRPSIVDWLVARDSAETNG